MNDVNGGDGGRITGVMVYYYKVCHRKLWYFCHEIQMEHGNENVQIGKLIDENSYGREDKHINIDNVINIDFIRTSKVLHEVKKSNKVEEASVYQVKYYLYYLEGKGVYGVRGQLDYPLLKKTVEVELTDEDREEMKKIQSEVNEIVCREAPPTLSKKRICKSCAYYDLCFI